MSYYDAMHLGSLVCSHLSSLQSNTLPFPECQAYSHKKNYFNDSIIAVYYYCNYSIIISCLSMKVLLNEKLQTLAGNKKLYYVICISLRNISNPRHDLSILDKIIVFN